MKKIVLIFLTMVLMTALVLTGCGGSGNEPTDGTDQGLEGTVVIAGSTSVQPLSEELAAAFMDINPNASIEVQGGGSGVGIKSANEGVADIGASSRDLKDEEKAGLTEYLIAKDGIAIIVNSSVNVTDLSLEKIKGIFTGEITNWKELGGADKAITVVSREAGSGTRGAFIAITGIETKDANGENVDLTTDKSLIQPSQGAVMQTVANSPDSIGYTSIGSLNDTVKTITVEGVEPTDENIVSGTYKMARPFIYITKGTESELAKAYIDFVLSAEGQAIVSADYVSVQ
jgi:phosphate transport system substrate-binding protein